MPRTILDVSRWQGSIDWDKVKASGLISGVMIRAMGNSKEGKPSKPYLDPFFARNYAECTRLGIPVGVYAMLYTGLNFGQNNLYMGGAALKPYDVWLAAYRTKKPAPDWAFGMWQYTSSGKIPGIAKGADLSVAYKDYAAIIQRAGLGQVRG